LEEREKKKKKKKKKKKCVYRKVQILYLSTSVGSEDTAKLRDVDGGYFNIKIRKLHNKKKKKKIAAGSSVVVRWLSTIRTRTLKPCQ
jgi:hypothetical protein